MNETLNKEEQEDLINYLCFCYSSFNLLNLNVFLGNENFLKFLDSFAGSSIRVPTNKQMLKHIKKYKIYLKYLKMKQLLVEQKIKDWDNIKQEINNDLIQLESKNPQKDLDKIILNIKDARVWRKKLNEYEERKTD